MTRRAQQAGLAAVAALAALLALPPGPAAADGLPAPQASYRAQETVEAGGRRVTAAVRRADGAARRELDRGGRRIVTLTRPEKRRFLLRMPGRGRALSLPYELALATLATAHLQGLTAEPLATGAVAGLAVTEYRLTGTTPDGLAFDGRAWITEDGIRAKIAGTVQLPDGSRTPIRVTLADVRRGPQPPQAFRLPDGVTAVDGTGLPPGLAGGVLGGLGR